MAQPSSKAELVTYIKRRLGEPVIKVDVAPVQFFQCIDDALALYRDYHYDSHERVYFKRQITASNVILNAASTGTFSNGEYAIGQTSNTYIKIYGQANTTSVQFTYKEKPTTTELEVGEIITGQTSGATGVVSSITLGDWDNEYIETSNSITTVYHVLPVNTGIVGGERGSGLFSTIFPYIANDIGNMTISGDMASYYITKSTFEMVKDLLVGDIGIRYNRHVNRVYMDVNWGLKFRVGDWVVLEAEQTLDPETYTEIWADRFVRDYATALVKKQWGQNLIKFDGVPMSGGITLNGKQIYEEGNREAKELEDKIQDKYETPPGFIIC